MLVRVGDPNPVQFEVDRHAAVEQDVALARHARRCRAHPEQAQPVAIGGSAAAACHHDEVRGRFAAQHEHFAPGNHVLVALPIRGRRHCVGRVSRRFLVRERQ
jgi:hypothetical protein